MFSFGEGCFDVGKQVRCTRDNCTQGVRVEALRLKQLDSNLPLHSLTLGLEPSLLAIVTLCTPALHLHTHTHLHTYSVYIYIYIRAPKSDGYR